MAITSWNPSTQISRGNILVGVAPAVADINSPSVMELTATGGTDLSFSIQTMNGTSSTDSETIDWLGTVVSETIPGSVTHEMDDLTIKSTGQADADLVTALKVGQKVYLWRRDGVAVTTAPAVGQFVWVWEVIITSIDPTEANNTFVGIVAHITVLRRSDTAVALVA